MFFLTLQCSDFSKRAARFFSSACGSTSPPFWKRSCSFSADSEGAGSSSPPPGDRRVRGGGSAQVLAEPLRSSPVGSDRWRASLFPSVAPSPPPWCSAGLRLCQLSPAEAAAAAGVSPAISMIMRMLAAASVGPPAVAEQTLIPDQRSSEAGSAPPTCAWVGVGLPLLL